MAQAMDQETIFVQTDPAFDFVLNSLTELRNQNRLQTKHVQTASLQDIECNNPSDGLRFIFGGLYGFARTASSVLRMCMLAATDINPGLWPTIGPYSKARNEAKLKQSIVDPTFSLADNKHDARKYWSKYDQLYRHFLIQQNIQSVPTNTQISLPRMMFIFRSVGNLTEVIEITTTFTATRRVQPIHFFNTYIHVTCIVRSVQADFQMVEFMDWPFTKRLKEHLKSLKIEGLFLMAQAQETIFVQTDPTFDIVLNSLTELRNQNRLQITHQFQTASLQDIESNNSSHYLRFTFGGVYGFARTASSVLRMCMLAATNINEELWPTIGEYSQARNEEKMVVQLPGLPLSLAYEKPDAIKYWSKYDQLYPHFLIQQEIQSVLINTPTSVPSMMIICRSVGSFTEVIEINTTFTATRRDQELASTCFNSYIHVTCIARSFQKNLLMDGPFTQSLNAELLNRPPRMEGLSSSFNNLAISPR